MNGCLRWFTGATMATVMFVNVGRGGELNADQELIVACYNVDVMSVVCALRKGADVNGRFAEPELASDPLADAWGGHSHLGSDRWTPLLALASSSKLPPPPKSTLKVWKNKELAKRLRSSITADELVERQRRVDEILRILLSHNCNVHADDGFGATALFKAVERDDVQTARTLLGFGSQVNKATRAYIDGPNGVTPLHAACNSAEMFQLLLDHGADPDVKDSDGNTPKDWQKSAKQVDKREWLPK